MKSQVIHIQYTHHIGTQAYLLCSSHLHSDRNSMNMNCLLAQCMRKLSQTPRCGRDCRSWPQDWPQGPRQPCLRSWLGSPLHCASPLPPEMGENLGHSLEPWPEMPGFASFWFWHELSGPAGSQIVQGHGWAPARASGVCPPQDVWGSDSRLSIGCVLLPGAHPRHTQNCPDLLLGVRVALHEDRAWDKCRTLDVGMYAPLTPRRPITGGSPVDEDSVAAVGGGRFLHGKANRELHVHRDSP